MRAGIIPIYNEAERLSQVLPGLAPYFQRLILIDDASGDESGAWLKEWAKDRPEVELLTLAKHSGKAAALKAGFARVLELKNRLELPPETLVFTTDADGQIPQRIIPVAELKLKQKKLDLLIGERDFALYPAYKIWGNRLLTWNASRLSGFAYRDSECGFRVFTLNALEKLFPYLSGEKYGLEQEVAVLAPRLGLKVANDLPVQPEFYRSNTRMSDFFGNFFTGLRARGRALKKNKGDAKR